MKPTFLPQSIKFSQFCYKLRIQGKGKSSPYSTAEHRVRSWSRFLAVSLQMTWVINPMVGCHYFPPSLQLPSQPLRGLLPISLLGEQRHDTWKSPLTCNTNYSWQPLTYPMYNLQIWNCCCCRRLQNCTNQYTLIHIMRCSITAANELIQSHDQWHQVLAYSKLLDLCKAADVFFPHFLIPAKDLSTQCCSLFVLLFANQVTEVLQTNALKNTIKTTSLH